MNLYYTTEQTKFIEYLSDKVKKIFLNYSESAHGIDHIERVVSLAKEIGIKENARSVFLCELSAWLHDIGRTRENNPGETSRKHHELSYKMLRDWFREERQFDFLTDDEKKELLYSVRYHWNDGADKYDTAWILRDADKLDGLGKNGMNRAWSLMKDDDQAWNQNFRNTYHCFQFLITKTAREIAKEKNLLLETNKIYFEYLKSKIEPIEL